VNVLTIEKGRARLLRRLRKICLALEGATEKEAWGDPTWRVRDRIFAMAKGNHEGGRPSLWVKGAPGAQEVLVGARPSVFFVPPYVGHKGWVGIYLDGTSLEWDVVGELIVESWRLVAGPRLAAQLPEAPAAPAAKGARPAKRARAGKRPSAARAAKKKVPARKAGAQRQAKQRSGAKR
jgi:predicted DNA-binding protein (MmcQ/YjbR family)